MDKRTGYLILGAIAFLVVGILAFDVYVLKFGKFWEKKPAQEATQPILSPTLSPASSITLQQAESIIKKIAATIIKPELIPSNSATVDITPKDAKNVESPNATISFASSWKDNKGVVFQINASFKSDSDILNSYDVVIGIPRGMIKSLDPSSAGKFVINYINSQINPVFKCEHTNKKIPEFTVCKASLEENSGVKPTLQVVYPL